MKYVDSYEWTETFNSANLVTPQYSGWFDVGFANEIYSDVSMVFSDDSGGATFDCDLFKYSKYAADSELLSHTQIGADGTTVHEQSVSAVGAGSAKIGTKVRYKFTLGSTWTGTVTVVFKGTIVAKRN